jgi:hypothetical protein
MSRRPGADGIGRRTYLRTAATGLAGTAGFASTAAGKRDGKEIVEQSLRVKDATNSIDRWHEYLRDRGFGVASDSHRFAIDVDGPSTDHYKDQKFLDITITLSIDCSYDGTYYTDLSWTYEEDGAWLHDAAGAPPVDIAGIGYHIDWWDLESYTISETTSMSEYVSYRDGTADGTGPGFEMDDDAMSYYGDDDDIHWCGLYIEPIGDYDSDERRLQGGYTHTWKEVTIDSVSVSYPGGVSVSVSDETKSWDTDTEQDGDTLLRLRQSDAYGCF